eukprot:Clim_evm35s225 gene=Clim_evmTU35s225
MTRLVRFTDTVRSELGPELALVPPDRLSTYSPIRLPDEYDAYFANDPPKQTKWTPKTYLEICPLLAKDDVSDSDNGGMSIWDILVDARSRLESLARQQGASTSAQIKDWVRNVFDTMKSHVGNEDTLQAALFDLIGAENIETLSFLLDNHEEIVKNLDEELEVALWRIEHEKGSGGGQSKSMLLKDDRAERKQKQIAKLKKSGALARNRDMESMLQSFGLLTLEDESEKPTKASKIIAQLRELTRESDEKYPFVFEDRAKEYAQSAAGNAFGKLMLPAGTLQDNNRVFESFSLPATATRPPAIPLVDVAESFSLLAQMAFASNERKITKLNRMQSIVFPAAYLTNENLLICAPTGAGKTNVALMTVLREVERNVDADGILQLNNFKIVYIAPMKALAAEMTENFGKRLAPLGITVKEVTGDTQLSKAEISSTQMIVSTPEKWDVISRKGTGDVALTEIVKLLIIDEVHLLHDERGPVIETIVARTLRQVESKQSLIRIVGLSATLPGYIDVAQFLRVNPHRGMFYFGSMFRPVPLSQEFIGVKAKSRFEQKKNMNEIAWDKVLENVRDGHQVMVFVHSRNETVKTAMALRDFANQEQCTELFCDEDHPEWHRAVKAIQKSKNKQLKELFEAGFAMHNAGMLRSDRNMVEKYFGMGLIRVLCCTATLAWGVNLPAHAVVIKGTDIYDSKTSSFVDLGILDVLQIFGRAGRPQFDTSGLGIIITDHKRLFKYLNLISRQAAIESQFDKQIADNLNAEVSLGTVNTIDDAVRWLSYSYFYVRLQRNPLAYGVTHEDFLADPTMLGHRRLLLERAAVELDQARMIRYNQRTGSLAITDLGRTASNFYISWKTITKFNNLLRPQMSYAEIIQCVAQSEEFEQIKVRDEELKELEKLKKTSSPLPDKSGIETSHGKVNALLQAYISQHYLEVFSLVSDTSYIAQNSQRIFRAVFEIALKKGWASLTAQVLRLCKMVERRQWVMSHPLKQFLGTLLKPELVNKIEDKGISIEEILDMEPADIGHWINHPKMGTVVKRAAEQFPALGIEATIQPITRTVLRLHLELTAEFTWNERIHGRMESWYIWVEDPDSNNIYHYELFHLHREQATESQSLVFSIPIFEPTPAQYYVKAVSDRWLGAEYVVPITFDNLTLPKSGTAHTELLDLEPLPISALQNAIYESSYKFSHFNPIQTQLFHRLYHTDDNVLLGAPTGSGKTIAAEIAIYRSFQKYPKNKVVYIAPLKALVRERVNDWKPRFKKDYGKNVVELTGNFSPDIRAINNANLVVTTPEKWDAVSRSWQNRPYVRQATLMVIDEIHLLGGDRGPVLEVIVSRTNYISQHTKTNVRIIGLSTALANADDLANWLNIRASGLYNFRPSVRPVPLEVHIAGFPGKHYCPRMATMNKPAFNAIMEHSPTKPVLIFVSSRRQTRLTAMDIISLCASQDNPRHFLHTDEMYAEEVAATARDESLRVCLTYGVGMHHAGLVESDRKLVEQWFLEGKIQILVATSTLAWGVNFPAHLVVVKGTEYYDGKQKRYVDYPITDVLQMMGRAGRPQFDTSGKAVIFVHDVKKNFYKKFLYEPFPVESSLHEHLPDHINAEIVAGTIRSAADIMHYLTWTYFFRRLLQNPSYYGLDETSTENVNEYLSDLADDIIDTLETSGCIEINREVDRGAITPLSLGQIASYYYLSHQSVRRFEQDLDQSSRLTDMLLVLSHCYEFDELPVRHNEDVVNEEFSKSLPLTPAFEDKNDIEWESPYVKTHLLLQAHFSSDVELPIADYVTDTKTVMDQAVRILQAMIDILADQGWLQATCHAINVLQMIHQGQWLTTPSIATLLRRRITQHHTRAVLQKLGINWLHVATVLQAFHAAEGGNNTAKKQIFAFQSLFSGNEWRAIRMRLECLPHLDIKTEIIDDNHTASAKGPGMKGRNKSRKHPTSVSGITLYITNRAKKPKRMAFTPGVHKDTDDQWMVLLCDQERDDVLALKRFVLRPSLQIFISLEVAHELGYVKEGAKLSLLVMSPCYLGLDQCLTLTL